MPSRRGTGKGGPFSGDYRADRWGGGAQPGLTPPGPFPTQALVLHPEQPAGLPEEAQGALGLGQRLLGLLTWPGGGWLGGLVSWG